MKIRVGHLYPDYLNIYADRGNIAVLARRAEWRGHELEVESISMGDALRPDAHDLLYVGGESIALPVDRSNVSRRGSGVS